MASLVVPTAAAMSPTCMPLLAIRMMVVFVAANRRGEPTGKFGISTPRRRAAQITYDTQTRWCRVFVRFRRAACRLWPRQQPDSCRRLSAILHGGSGYLFRIFAQMTPSVLTEWGVRTDRPGDSAVVNTVHCQPDDAGGLRFTRHAGGLLVWGCPDVPPPQARWWVSGRLAPHLQGFASRRSRTLRKCRLRRLYTPCAIRRRAWRAGAFCASPVRDRPRHRMSIYR